MGKVLVIAEKPSVARDIAGVLGCRQKGEGYLYGDTHIVSWAIGHLVSLYEPEDYDDTLKRWRLETLPIIPADMKLKVLPKTKKQFGVLKGLLNDRDVDSLICATDSGREGELIFRYIYRLCGCKKPFQRLWISSMTEEAIREGFARLRPGRDYDSLYESARCRSEADWLVGMNATRAFTVKHGVLLSVGRVQTPTLAILAARQREIDAFVPRDYYEVQNDYGDFKGVWYDKDIQQTKIFEKERADGIAARVMGQSGTVFKVVREQKSQPFPQLYDLTELQRDANRYLGFSAQKTLTAAQSLYEKHKLITYPRTDSRYLSTDLIPELKPVLKTLDIEPYSGYVGGLFSMSHLPTGPRLVNNAKVKDHHAIIPTRRIPNFSQLPNEERRVYDLIARRFIAAFYPPYEYELAQIHTVIMDETFISRGTAIKALGWKELYKDSKTDGGSDEQPLPPCSEGDGVTALQAEVLKKKTAPPKPYTEAGLLSAMENAGRFVEEEELKEQLKDSGLGTPATRAAIIERLLKVGYIVRKGKTLIPTQKGMNLIDVVPDELKSPETTGKWEKALNHIARGAMEPEKFMAGITRYVNYLVQEAAKGKPGTVFEKDKAKSSGTKAQAKTSAQPEARTQAKARGQSNIQSKADAQAQTKAAGGEPLGKCPLCSGGSITANSKGYGCSNFRNGCRFFIGEISGKKLTPVQVRTLLAKGKTGVLKGFKSAKGIPFGGRLILQNGKIHIEREEQSDGKD